MNIARRHRHGKAWDKAGNYAGPLTSRDRWQILAVIAGCLSFWVAVFWWVFS